MKELLKAIQSISNDLKSIEKDMTVGSGRYTYKAVSDLAVTKKVKESEAEHGVVSIPLKQELIKSEILKTVRDDGKESITYVDTIKMTLVIYHVETEQSLEIESFGRGLDSGDKGFGKASTYARKYALLNAYKIATGEDPDAEKSKEEKVLSVSEKTKIVIDYLSKNNNYAVGVLKHFGVESINDLSDIHINQVYKNLKTKKIL